MKKTLFTLLLVSVILMSGCSPKVESDNDIGDAFSFVFMTDIHLQPEENAVEGFQMAMTEVNYLKPDFVITGGDLVMDALEESYERADSLYDLYLQEIQMLDMPVYNTIGNHEVFGLYEKSGVDPGHPEYKYGMYEGRIGETYYSFDHKGWHFIVLNSVQEDEDREYYGMIDQKQMDWIKSDLVGLDPEMPIVISTHIPFLTVFTQILYGEYAPDYHGLVVENAREVIDLFAGHNLKLVLQGHLHYLEDIEVYGTHFITVGAVCARWWKGANDGVEEGFLKVNIHGDDFCWEYVDYGWEVK
jgi:Icc protein